MGDDDAQLYDEAADIIQQDYYRKIDREQLVNKALGSAVDSLNDRFSAYFDPKAYKSFEEATQGAFEGVGMNVEEVPRGLRILTVFKDSPAAKGGLKPGDEILLIDGLDVRRLNAQQINDILSGEVDSPVKLTVIRDEQVLRVTLKRTEAHRLSKKPVKSP